MAENKTSSATPATTKKQSRSAASTQKEETAANQPIAPQSRFETPEIVIMITIAVLNDLFTLLADLSLAVPFLGEAVAALAWVSDLVVWGGILVWFALKVGLLNTAGLVQTIGGLTDFVGIPGRTISAAVGIFLVNHPKLGKVASTITNPEGAITSEVTGGTVKE